MKYLAYSFLGIAYLLTMNQITLIFKEMYNDTFQLFPNMYFAVLLYLPLGIYLGIPSLYKKIKRDGKWKINHSLLVFVTLPMVIIAFFYPLIFSLPLPSHFKIPKLFIGAHDELRLGMVVAGYSLIKSFNILPP
ncbi:hypothetical protein, partial [Bacillus solimangrovi]